MTIEFVYLDLDAFLHVGDDQKYFVMPSEPPVGWDGNSKFVLLDTFGGSQPTVTTGPVDTEPPVVDNFNPVIGTEFPATQPISFHVTDDSGEFRRIIVHARFADGLEEVVSNGDSFRGWYGGGNSARVLIPNGFAYTIFREGGWPQGGPVAINVFAIDAVGNENA